MVKVFMLSLVLLTPVSGESVELRQVLVHPKQAEDFKLVAEYFSGEEATGYRTIARSDPSVREGLYFILRLDTRVRKLPEGIAVQVKVIGPDDPAVRHYRLIVPAERAGGKEIFAGLTGEDWPFGEEMPVAWQVQLEDAQGKVIVADQSFLWSEADLTQPPATARANQ